MNIGQRLDKVERRLDVSASAYPENCICFPHQSDISVTPEEAEAIRSVPCPLHGDRMAALSEHPPVYRAAWLQRYVPPITAESKPWEVQLEKAWKATPGERQ